MDFSTSFLSDDFLVLKIFTGLVLLWITSVSIYRVFLSPLAKIPGPKLAGLTSWYEFYYDVVKGGQFTFHLQDLHRKYGPSPKPPLLLPLRVNRSNCQNKSYGSSYRRSRISRNDLFPQPPLGQTPIFQ
jgi:hypothetical protein